MKTNYANPKTKDCCCFCGQYVNLDDEGVQYGNGKCAHEHCDDANQFNKANEADFRD